MAATYFVDIDTTDEFMDLEPPKYAQGKEEQIADGILEPLPIPELPPLTEH